MDWIGFGLAFYAEDIKFNNDPDDVIRTLIMVVCVLATAFWLLQFVLFRKFEEKFLKFAPRFNFAQLLVEDGMQFVLYSIVASGNASSKTLDNAERVAIGIAAGTQSLLFLVIRMCELFSEQLETSTVAPSG